MLKNLFASLDLSIARRMSFYAVRTGKRPGIYATWLVFFKGQFEFLKVKFNQSFQCSKSNPVKPKVKLELTVSVTDSD